MKRLKLHDPIHAANRIQAGKRLQDIYYLYALQFPPKDGKIDPRFQSDVLFIASLKSESYVVALIGSHEKLRELPQLAALSGRLEKDYPGQVLRVYQLRPPETKRWTTKIAAGIGALVTILVGISSIYLNLFGKDAPKPLMPLLPVSVSQTGPLRSGPAIQTPLAPERLAAIQPTHSPVVPAPALAVDGAQLRASFVTQGRWKTAADGDCQVHSYSWDLAGGMFRFVDEKGRVDLERVLPTNDGAAGYVTETVRSVHDNGSASAAGTKWRYEMQPDGRVLVHNLATGHSFSLYRCP